MFQFVPITSSPITRTPSSLLPSPYIHWINPPELSHPQAEHPQLSLPFPIYQTPQAFHHLHGPSLDLLQYVQYISLILGSPELDTSLQETPGGAMTEQERGITFPDLLAVLCLMQPGMLGSVFLAYLMEWHRYFPTTTTARLVEQPFPRYVILDTYSNSDLLVPSEAFPPLSFTAAKIPICNKGFVIR